MAAAPKTPRLTYPATLAMLGLALAFPVGLMVFNPTLMFERGWEQFVGTGIYFWALLALGRELFRLWGDERSFREAPGWLDQPESIREADRRILPARLRGLAGAGREGLGAPFAQLMELNREGSALDAEGASGRFTLPRYILYLLPVIGFIGTVEGISKALMNISLVLPMVNDLDGFMANLTGVTSALQIAFDSTLLALFLSASLMLVQTLVHRRSEDLLARIDRWVVDHALPRLGRPDAPSDNLAAAIAPHLDRLRDELKAQTERTLQLLEALDAKLVDGLGAQVDRFAGTIERLGPAVAGLERGAEVIARVGDDLEGVGQANESLRRGLASLSRIEGVLEAGVMPAEPFDQVRRGLDRTCAAVEALSGQWSAAFDRTSRASQEQLSRTLNSLKDALDLLNVSIEQGNSLYRSIVKKLFDDRLHASGADSSRAA